MQVRTEERTRQIAVSASPSAAVQTSPVAAASKPRSPTATSEPLCLDWSGTAEDSTADAAASEREVTVALARPADAGALVDPRP